MGQSPEMWAYKCLRTKRFHGVSSAGPHTYLLKSRYGKVSDLRLVASTCTMPFVTTMVLVTTSVRSGRVSRFPLVRCIARAVCRQPQPVGWWSAWRMRNKLRKICTHHRLEDRLRGTTRTNHRGYHTPIRTTEQSLADSPRSRLSGSREGESLPGGAQRSPPTTSITSQITTVELDPYDAFVKKPP